MQSVGVRDLKNRLSHHLKRVRAGVHLTVTERGRPIATLAPIAELGDLAWLHKMVTEGRVQWSGGKPTGSKNPPRLKGHPGSDAILAGRR